MVVAVGCVAVLAESGIVIEPGRMDLAEVQGRAERLGDPAGPAGEGGAVEDDRHGKRITSSRSTSTPWHWKPSPECSGHRRAVITDQELGDMLTLARRMTVHDYVSRVLESCSRANGRCS